MFTTDFSIFRLRRQSANFLLSFARDRESEREREGEQATPRLQLFKTPNDDVNFVWTKPNKVFEKNNGKTIQDYNFIKCLELNRYLAWLHATFLNAPFFYIYLGWYCGYCLQCLSEILINITDKCKIMVFENAKLCIKKICYTLWVWVLRIRIAVRQGQIYIEHSYKIEMKDYY